MFGIYIHIPFCLKKCSYCDFHSVALPKSKIPEVDYVKSLNLEMTRLIQRFDLTNRKVGSIYFGGGTPSVFSPKMIAQILDPILGSFNVSKDVEITMECNPGTKIEKDLPTFREIGINRLSVGVQSFNDSYLKKLGRIHNSEEAKNTIVSAKKAGFKNVSLDIMWGLKGQSLKELQADLKNAVDLGVEHISAYQLTIDGKQYHNEEVSREMWLEVDSFLTRAGFEHYEISNFAWKNMKSRHNENYWNYGEWLGLGSGATSFLNGNTRLNATKDVEKYLACEFEYETEEITKNEQMAEFSFLGLRKKDGILMSEFKKRFKKDFGKVYPGLKERWIKKGFAESDGERLKLTLEGFLVSDSLFKDLII